MTRRAFTLVEMLVVVAIIVTLLAILGPTIALAMKHANTTVCASNLSQINVAFTGVFTDDPIYSPYPYPGNHNGAFDHFWMGKIANRVSDLDRIRVCPEASRDDGHAAGTATTTWNGRHHPKGYWIHRNEDVDGDSQSDYWYGSYGMNAWMYNGSPADWSWPGNQNYDRNYRDAGPGVGLNTAPTFVDCAWVDLWPSTYDLPAPNLLDPYRSGWSGGMARSALDRHLKGVNVVFMDGHAQYVKLPDLWSLKWSKSFQPGKGTPAL